MGDKMNQREIRKILIVDDEPLFAEFLHLVLTKEGYEISTAKDGKEGIEIFESIKPDLVITDIVMPDMEGIEFIRILLKKRKTLPVIAMSGNATGIRFLRTSRLFGARAVLQKPITFEKLKETIAAVKEIT